MQAFHIRYRNTQGTLMRILNAASRRGLDLPSVHAASAERDHRIVLELEVNPKQVGQLFREWYAIADVIEVGSSEIGSSEVCSGEVGSGAMHAEEWAVPRLPEAVALDDVRAAAQA